MLGARPSFLFAFFDVDRFAELLVDGTQTIPASTAEILDANARATGLVRAAESDIVQACRVKNLYSLQQLRDLVLDYSNTPPNGGDQIVSLIAELTWARTIRRKRYAAGTPQGDDPAWKMGQDQLEQLRRGERIFVMDNVPQTDGAGTVIGTYSDEVSQAGLMEGSSITADVGCPTQLWGSKRTPINELDPCAYVSSGTDCGCN